MSDVADIAAELIADDELITAHAQDFVGGSYLQIILRDGAPGISNAPARLNQVKRRLLEVRDNVNARSVEHAVRRLMLRRELERADLIRAARANVWDGLHRSLVSDDPVIRYDGVGAADIQRFITTLLPPDTRSRPPRPMAMQ